MAPITGAQTKLVIEKGTVFGTEVAVGATDAMGVRSFSPTNSADTLEGNSLGTGLVMQTNEERGNVQHGASLSMIAGYQNGFDMLLAQFLGDPQAPAEQTVGQGDYMHSIQMDVANAGNGWVNIARTLSSTLAESYPSCAVTQMTLSVGTPTAPLVADFTLIADNRIFDSAVNTHAVITAATLKEQRSIMVKNESEFLLDVASSGALSSADRIAIVAWNLTLNRPLTVSPEIKGTVGNGEFSSDGFVNGELSVTMSKLDALTFFDAVDDEEYFKSSFIVVGAQIGTGVSRKFQMDLPRLKLLTYPDYALSVPGNNPVTLAFRIYAADAAPTGFTTVYPRATLINTRTTVY